MKLRLKNILKEVSPYAIGTDNPVSKLLKSFSQDKALLVAITALARLRERFKTLGKEEEFLYVLQKSAEDIKSDYKL